MKKRKDLLRGFVLGVLLTALAAAIPAVGAAATKRTIDVVYNDIKLVIDGKEITPLDGAGNPVEPFIYEGTTYLPLRAVSNALTNGEKPVSWDQSTYTVYIGERPVEAQKIVNMADMKSYPNGLTAFKTGDSFKVRQQTYTPFNSVVSYSYNWADTYLLNGDYTTFEGMVAAIDGSSNPPFSGSVVFTNADTNEVLLEVVTEPMKDPVPVTVDVTGVDRLTIRVDTKQGARLFNATLTTISRG